MTTTAAQALWERLPGFFDAYAKMRSTPEKMTLAEWLPGFFDGFSICRAPIRAPAAPRVAINPNELASFFASLAQPIIDARQSAFSFDPWEVADLGKDEVRNTSVLAWLLNPLGSHGLASAGMNGLLTTVNHHFQSISHGDFLAEPGKFCRVRTEINPNGEVDDRVDIEIDAENFYLIIEVKIKAPEQVGQLERYCRQAEERARSRPWAVVFLTPQGRKPNSSGKYANSGRIVPLSWKKLASVLEQELPNRKAIPDQSRSISRRVAEQAVQCFIKKIRLF